MLHEFLLSACALMVMMILMMNMPCGVTSAKHPCPYVWNRRCPGWEKRRYQVHHKSFMLASPACLDTTPTTQGSYLTTFKNVTSRSLRGAMCVFELEESKDLGHQTGCKEIPLRGSAGDFIYWSRIRAKAGIFSTSGLLFTLDNILYDELESTVTGCRGFP